jgi:hypothetical protein
MTTATPDIPTYFFTQGILGVLVLVLAFVCFKLYTKVQTLQDARLQDAKDVAKDVTTVLSANTTSNNLLAAKIESGKRGR